MVIKSNFTVKKNSDNFNLLKKSKKIKGSIHKYYYYTNYLLNFCKNKNIFYLKYSKNIFKKQTSYLAIHFYKKQFFLENLKIINFFKNLNFKNYFYKKNLNVIKNSNQYSKNKFLINTFNKEDDSSLYLINLMQNKKFFNIFDNTNYNLNLIIYINNLKNLYIIIIYLFINKIN